MTGSVDPSTLQPKPDCEVHCSRCGERTPPAAARFILADLYGTPWLSGRPLIYCMRCAAEMREHVVLETLLTEVDFARALREGWFEHGTLDVFVDMVGALSCQRQVSICTPETPCEWCLSSPWSLAAPD
jgi:hypothetical protein